MRKFHSHLIILIILTLVAAVEIGITGCKESSVSTDAGGLDIGGGGNAAIENVDDDKKSDDDPLDPPGMSAPPVDLPTPITGRILVTSPNERGEVFVIGEEGAVGANSVVLIMKEAVVEEPRSFLNLLVRSAYAEVGGGGGGGPKEFSPICYKPLNKCVRADEFGAFRASVMGTIRGRLKIVQILSSGDKNNINPKFGVALIKHIPMYMHPVPRKPSDAKILYTNDGNFELIALLEGGKKPGGGLIQNAITSLEPSTMETIGHASANNGTRAAHELLLTSSNLFYTDVPGTESNIYSTQIFNENFKYTPPFKEGIELFNTFEKHLPRYSYIGTHIIDTPPSINLFDSVLMVGNHKTILSRPLSQDYRTIQYRFPFGKQWTEFKSDTPTSTKIINKGSCEGENVVGVIHEYADSPSKKRYLLSLISGEYFINSHVGTPDEIASESLDLLPTPFQLTDIDNPTDIAFINNDARCEIVITDSSQNEPKIAIYKYSQLGGENLNNHPLFKMDLEEGQEISEYHNIPIHPEEILISPWIDHSLYKGNLIFVTSRDINLKLLGLKLSSTDVVFSLAYIDKNWTIVSVQDVGFAPSGMSYQDGPTEQSRALFVSSHLSQTITRIPLHNLLPPQPGPQ